MATGWIRRGVALMGVMGIVVLAACTLPPTSDPATGSGALESTSGSSAAPNDGLREVQLRFINNEWAKGYSFICSQEGDTWEPLVVTGPPCQEVYPLPIDGERYPVGATMTIVVSTGASGGCTYTGGTEVGCSPPVTDDVCWRVFDITAREILDGSEVCRTVSWPSTTSEILTEITFPLPRRSNLRLGVESLGPVQQCNSFGCSNAKSEFVFSTALVRW